MTTNNTPKQPTQSNVPALPDSDSRSQANIDRRQRLRIAERDELGRLYPGSVLERAGRPEGPSVTVLARKHTQAAMNTLAEIMLDPKAPQAARATSAQALLDRGWGKAPIQIDTTVRAKFDDFLRDVGRAAQARRAAAQAITDVSIKAALDDQGRKVDEDDGACEV